MEADLGFTFTPTRAASLPISAFVVQRVNANSGSIPCASLGIAAFPLMSLDEDLTVAGVVAGRFQLPPGKD